MREVRQSAFLLCVFCALGTAVFSLLALIIEGVTLLRRYMAALFTALLSVLVFVRFGYRLQKTCLCHIIPVVCAPVFYDDIFSIEVKERRGLRPPYLRLILHSGESRVIFPAGMKRFYARLVLECRRLEAV